MRLPRDVSGRELARALEIFGYEITRQTGSHLRLTTLRPGEHHLTNRFMIRCARDGRPCTLAGILGEVAKHFELSRDKVAARVFGKDR